MLDTTALIAKYHMSAYAIQHKLYTTPSAYAEARDRESRESLDLALSIGRIVLKEPSIDSIRYVERKAMEVGERIRLSRTDIEIIALAIDLLKQHDKVIVLSDDYAVQNLLLHIGIPFKPLRTMGIIKAKRYVMRCPVCKYTTIDLKEGVCPICGTKLIKSS